MVNFWCTGERYYKLEDNRHWFTIRLDYQEESWYVSIGLEENQEGPTKKQLSNALQVLGRAIEGR